MTVRGWIKWLLMGALAGVGLGWALPMLAGPPIGSYALTLRDNPRLSDAVLGLGSLGVYIAQAPSLYLGLHTTDPSWPPAPVNAGSWALIGAVVAAFVLAVGAARRERTPRTRLLAGALGGLLIGWLLPAVASVLGECFAHCYMHEGPLGDMALAGGTLLRVFGTLAEAPWRLLFETAATVTPPPAIPVSAAVWAAVGAGIGIALGAPACGRRVPGGDADAPDRKVHEA